MYPNPDPYPEPELPRKPRDRSYFLIALVVILALGFGSALGYIAYTHVGTSKAAVATATPRKSTLVPAPTQKATVGAQNTPGKVGQGNPTATPTSIPAPTNTPALQGPALAVSPLGDQYIDCTDAGTHSVIMHLQNRSNAKITYTISTLFSPQTIPYGGWGLGRTLTSGITEWTIAAGLTAEASIIFSKPCCNVATPPGAFMKVTWYLVDGGKQEDVGTTTVYCKDAM